MSANLRYESVTLYVPYREGETSHPEDWDWQTLVDTIEPIIVCSTDPVPFKDADEILRVNGFDEPGDLADQLVRDA